MNVEIDLTEQINDLMGEVNKIRDEREVLMKDRIATLEAELADKEQWLKCYEGDIENWRADVRKLEAELAASCPQCATLRAEIAAEDIDFEGVTSSSELIALDALAAAPANDDVKSQWVWCPDCGGTKEVSTMDETEIGQPPGSSRIDCPTCTPTPPWPLTGTDAEKLKQYMGLTQKVMDADKKRIEELEAKLEGCDCDE